MRRRSLVDRGLGCAVALVSIASCLPSFPEIECAQDRDCLSGQCSGARCIPLQEALALADAQSALIVTLRDGEPQMVHAFELGGPINVAPAEQTITLLFPCPLEAIGLQAGEVTLGSTPEAQSLPFPNAAFERDMNGAWSVRDIYEAFEQLRRVRIVSTFDPCPTWREHALEMVGPAQSRKPSFLIPRPGGVAVFPVPATGIYRNDAQGTEVISTSTSVLTATVLHDDSIALFFENRCLGRLGEETPIVCEGPWLTRYDPRLASTASPEAEIYLAEYHRLFVLTDTWRELQIRRLIADYAPYSYLQPIGATDMLAAFSPFREDRDRGDFLRVRGSVIDVIPLPGDEEVTAFAASSDPSAVFVATDTVSGPNVYRFNGASFSLFSSRAKYIGTLTSFRGGVIVADRDEIVAIPYPGRDCPVGSLSNHPLQIAVLDEGSVVVLFQSTGLFLSRFRQVIPGATCGIAP
jgi:hypothetical protein